MTVCSSILRTLRGRRSVEISCYASHIRN
ncbi:hypothetical protein U0070_024526 [Myodes glareolus]|uniref:Uncharacterized protein n=1 Tax=Myodes glareolus TaxID=447135 RepID=A0AAW0HKR6_MYOGA